MSWVGVWWRSVTYPIFPFAGRLGVWLQLSPKNRWNIFCTTRSKQYLHSDPSLDYLSSRECGLAVSWFWFKVNRAESVLIIRDTTISRSFLSAAGVRAKCTPRQICSGMIMASVYIFDSGVLLWSTRTWFSLLSRSRITPFSHSKQLSRKIWRGVNFALLIFYSPLQKVMSLNCVSYWSAQKALVKLKCSSWLNIRKISAYVTCRAIFSQNLSAEFRERRFEELDAENAVTDYLSSGSCSLACDVSTSFPLFVPNVEEAVPRAL